MYYRKLIILTLFAFLIWIIPFLLTLSLSKDNNAQGSFISENKEEGNSVVQKIFDAYSQDNKAEVFRLIFFNNLKVATINIIGGMFLGLGTFVNLLFNGFYAAIVFSSIYQNGMEVTKIIEHTAPHSFEMIGIWLSGGLGFYITSLILNVMFKNIKPKTKDIKTIIVSIIGINLIILLAAYVEAYFSVN